MTISIIHFQKKDFFYVCSKYNCSGVRQADGPVSPLKNKPSTKTIYISVSDGSSLLDYTYHDDDDFRLAQRCGLVSLVVF